MSETLPPPAGEQQGPSREQGQHGPGFRAGTCLDVVTDMEGHSATAGGPLRVTGAEEAALQVASANTSEAKVTN